MASFIELTRLSGFKEAHIRFDEISEKLDTAYKSAGLNHDVSTAIAVGAIWAEMCTDNLLCKKLLQRGMHVPLVYYCMLNQSC